MPRILPPHHYQGVPRRRMFPAGTQRRRVHARESGPLEFSIAVTGNPFSGGRFGPLPEDEYSYLCATFSARTAVAEVLLECLPFDDQDARILPRAAVENRLLSSVELATEVTLLTLTTSADLAAVGQDEWLVQAGHADYPRTRRWARWLRRQAPWAHGLLWPSRRDAGGQAVCLFGDRCGHGQLRPGVLPTVELGGGPGAALLSEILADYRVMIRPAADPANS